jgi:uncharacterized protein YlzI (FlbEa/FlbD family)
MGKFISLTGSDGHPVTVNAHAVEVVQATVGSTRVVLSGRDLLVTEPYEKGVKLVTEAQRW